MKDVDPRRTREQGNRQAESDTKLYSHLAGGLGAQTGLAVKLCHCFRPLSLRPPCFSAQPLGLPLVCLFPGGLVLAHFSLHGPCVFGIGDGGLAYDEVCAYIVKEGEGAAALRVMAALI